MLIFRYKKTGAAAYISHLDTLRSIIRTIRRAGTEVNYSQGFNPHMNLYMSPPMPLGIESLCEYCAVDTPVKASVFAALYNRCCQNGMECTAAWDTVKNPNTAANITAAKYIFESAFLSENYDKIKIKDGFTITSQNEGITEEKDVKDCILRLEKTPEGISAVLKYGNSGNLRADRFAAALKRMLGEFSCVITKTEAYCGSLSVDEFIRQYLP